MGILDYNKRFGKPINISEVKRSFVNEINHFLIEPLDEKIGNYYSGGNPLFDHICLGLNLSPTAIIQSFNSMNFDSTSSIPSLRTLTSDNFDKTLVVIELAYSYFKNGNDYRRDEWLERIDSSVNLFIKQIISLGIYWYEGLFYPEGAKELDKKLVSDNLDWLEHHPKSKGLFKNALEHYSEAEKNPIKRRDVISNAFQSVEELIKVYLKNDKSFDNNFSDLVQKLNLPKQWANILNYYKELAKEFGRHSGRSEEFIPSPEETEAFVYLSGIVLRLISKKLS